jgi:hypothetical protein
MNDDEHPNADDYRNRAERAEQELAEVTELADGMAEALKEIADMTSKRQLPITAKVNFSATVTLAAWNLRNLG